MGDDTDTFGKGWSVIMKNQAKLKLNVDMDEYYFSLEEEMRKKHPAVRDAWERYQVILKLYETQDE